MGISPPALSVSFSAVRCRPDTVPASRPRQAELRWDIALVTSLATVVTALYDGYTEWQPQAPLVSPSNVSDAKMSNRPPETSAAWRSAADRSDVPRT